MRYHRRALYALLACAMLLLLGLASVARAEIEVYQGSTIEVQKSQPVEAQKSQPVEEHKSQTVDAHKGQTTEVHKGNGTVEVYSGAGTPGVYPGGRTLEPGGGAAPVSPYQSLDQLQYIPPQGWTTAKQDGMLFFLPPGAKPTDLCAIMVTSAKPVTGETTAWYAAEAGGHLAAGVKVVMKSDVARQRAGSTEILFSTQINETANGKRLYMAYAGLRQNATGQIVGFIADSADKFLTHLPAMLQFTRNVRMSDTAPKTDAPRYSMAVEPLSNGLKLTMTANEVIARFGKPLTDDRFWGGGIGYGDFGAIFDANGKQLTHFTLASPKVQLAGGIAVGRTKAEVLAAFPRGAWANERYQVTSGQYALTFAFAGDTVSGIKIDPAAGAFRDLQPTPTPAPKPAPKPEPKPAPKPVDKVTPDAFLGTWHGTALTVGTIVIKKDGTYDFNGTIKAGTYSVKGNEIFFTGGLKAWDNGRATLNKGALEFYWKNPDGGINWFSFAQ